MLLQLALMIQANRGVFSSRESVKGRFLYGRSLYEARIGNNAARLKFPATEIPSSYWAIPSSLLGLDLVEEHSILGLAQK